MGILSTLFGCKKQQPKNVSAVKEDSKYTSVIALPNGIEVIHTPDRVLAKEDGRSGYRYTWLHKTSVKSTVGDLRIIEFGAFAKDHDQWVFSTYTGKPFTPEDFAEWYSCPNAQLKDSKQFSDLQNWTGANILQENSTLWYFIGEDATGKKYKGIEQVDTLKQTIKSANKSQ